MANAFYAPSAGDASGIDGTRHVNIRQLLDGAAAKTITLIDESGKEVSCRSFRLWLDVGSSSVYVSLTAAPGAGGGRIKLDDGMVLPIMLNKNTGGLKALYINCLGTTGALNILGG